MTTERARTAYKKKFTKYKTKINKNRVKKSFKKCVKKIVDKNQETKLATYKLEQTYSQAWVRSSFITTPCIPVFDLIILNLRLLT